jgi:hypothetical protein
LCRGDRLCWRKTSDAGIPGGDIFTGHVQDHRRARGVRALITLGGGEVIPLVSLDPAFRRVLCHSQTGAMTAFAEVVLRSGVALLRGLVEPVG